MRAAGLPRAAGRRYRLFHSCPSGRPGGAAPWSAGRDGALEPRHRAARALGAALALAFGLLAGCPAHTDYGGAQRLTDHTAYTLEPGEVLVGAGLVGTRVENLLASVRLEWSPYVEGLEIGTNLAHDIISFVNFYAKYTPLDTRWVGVGVRAGFRWLSPGNVWLIPDDSEFKQDFGAVDMYMFPVSAYVSLPLSDWFGVHTELSYMYTPVKGDLVLDEVHYNAGAAWHELTVQPAVHFYPGRGVALLAGVQVPLYSAVFGEGYSEESDERLPGVRYGFQGSLSTEFDVTSLVSPWIGVHIAWEHVNVRVTGTWGLRFFDESTLEADGWLAYVPLPGFEVFWRL